MSGARLHTILFAHEIQARVSELARQIETDYPPRPGEPSLRVIGVLAGACFFVSDLVRAMDRDVSLDFLGVRSYGRDTRSSGEVQVTKDLDDGIEGLDVLIVEDIVDTGATIDHVLKMLERRAPRSLSVATLLNKPSRRIKPVKLNYIGFEIPDQFVVGYGLDYAGRYRNLRDICALEQED